MLVLARKKNEEIVIGTGPDAIRVCVVEIRDGKVRLGVIAPKLMHVNRREVFDAIHPEIDLDQKEGAA